MKRVFLSVCLLTSLLLTSCARQDPGTDTTTNPATAAETQAESVISSGFVNAGEQEYASLYQEPDTSSTVIARTYTGDAIDILELQGTWYHVRFGELTGYLNVTDVAFEQPTNVSHQPAASPQAAAQDIDYYAAYSSLVQKYDRNKSGYTWRYYGLFDLDGDGVMELILESGNAEADRWADVWDITTTKIGEIGMSHSILETDDNKLFVDTGHMGYQAITRVELINGTIVETEIYNSGDQMLDDYASYGKALPIYDFSDMTGLMNASPATVTHMETTAPKPVETPPPKSSKPTANISIEVEPPPPNADGDTLYLRVNGNYSYYEYDLYIGNEPGNYYNSDHGTSSESRMRITAGSDTLYVYAIVTPVSASGEKGETVKTTGTNYHPIDSISTSPESCFLWGEINTHGGVVAGFASSYVVEGGASSHVRDSLGNGWHVDAKRKCISHGVVWFELYDSDDGEYYGWVDATYIDFYAGG